MSDKVIRWTTVDGECVTHHAMRVDDGGEQCIRCHALADVLHAGFLCSACYGSRFDESPVVVTLTPQERRDIEWAANMLDDINRGDKEKSAVLRGIIGRTRGERVGYDAWIPVSQRLPALVNSKDARYVTKERYSDQVLVFDGSEVHVGTYGDVEGWLSGYETLSSVTHWMPLPAPPTDTK